MFVFLALRAALPPKALNHRPAGQRTGAGATQPNSDPVNRSRPLWPSPYPPSFQAFYLYFTARLGERGALPRGASDWTVPPDADDDDSDDDDAAAASRLKAMARADRASTVQLRSLVAIPRHIENPALWNPSTQRGPGEGQPTLASTRPQQVTYDAACFPLLAPISSAPAIRRLLHNRAMPLPTCFCVPPSRPLYRLAAARLAARRAERLRCPLADGAPGSGHASTSTAPRDRRLSWARARSGAEGEASMHGFLDRSQRRGMAPATGATPASHRRSWESTPVVTPEKSPAEPDIEVEVTCSADDASLLRHACRS
ncbi:hypothetical protein CDD83_1991 [Cordyceps sp. RAO-2017]|nr:hypothetical protein CDD83_1991 [Cordyceps sp. RAO-2017]